MEIELDMIAPAEHITPQGLEIRLYARPAKYTGLRGLFKKIQEAETRDELMARFHQVLEETDFTAIAKVYSVKQKSKHRIKQQSTVLQLTRRLEHKAE